MIGTIVNSIAILIGTGIGLLFRKLIKKEIWDYVLQALGLVIFIFGLIGVIKVMIFIDSNVLKSRFDLLLIISIALGTFIGGLLNIEDRMKMFGNYIEKRLNKGAFSEGFISATLIFCVGAMGIFGSVKDALGDPTILYLKSALDGITALILATTLGFGVLFSSVSVFIYQGFITLIAYFLGDFMSTEFVDVFSMVGYVMVAAIGINFIFPNKIKVANMLPSLLVIIVYFLITNFL